MIKSDREASLDLEPTNQSSDSLPSQRRDHGNLTSPNIRAHFSRDTASSTRHNGLGRIQVRRAEHHPEVPKQSSRVSATAVDGILRAQGGCGVKVTAEPKDTGPKGVTVKG